METMERKNLAVQFLNLIENFDRKYLGNLVNSESGESVIYKNANSNEKNAISVPLQICDVKLDNFGINSKGDLKIIDTDMVHPDSNLFYQRHCESHDDCHFFDCKSFCNLTTMQCGLSRVNNNLQSFCEKIFDNYYIKDDALLINSIEDGGLTKLLIKQCSMPGYLKNTNIPVKASMSLINKFRGSLTEH